MESSVRDVEEILKYKFKNIKLLEQALTHPSFTSSPYIANYQRLEFIGDSALSNAISNHLFLSHPDFDPSHLSLLRSTNTSNERLARVAVRHGLYNYVRRGNTPSLDHKVREFANLVQQEREAVVYGGAMKAPKILADILESLAGAVYVDCEFDLKAFWAIFSALLEPLVTLEVLQQQPQPITMLFASCMKDGKQVDIQHGKEGEKNIATVFVDGKFIASSSSDHKENAKLNAAKAALQKLSYFDRMDID